MTKKERSEAEIAEFSVLELLEQEEDFSGGGISEWRIASLIAYGSKNQFFKIIDSLEKKKWIKGRFDEVKITRKGKRELYNFRGDCTSKEWKIFQKQKSSVYHGLARINTLEIFIGYSLVGLIALAFIFLLSYIRVAIFDYPNWIFIVFTSILMIITVISVFMVYISMLMIIVRSISLLIRPISFTVSDYIINNIEKIVKKLYWIIILGGIIILTIILGIKGLLAGLLLTIIFELVKNRKKWIEKITSCVKKSKS